MKIGREVERERERERERKREGNQIYSESSLAITNHP
jgi:hypothetical protein